MVGTTTMNTPPRFADRLLELFCAPHLLEEVQGDLYERYVWDVSQLGMAKANRHYVLNVLGFLRPFAVKHQSTVRRSGEYPQPLFLHPAMLRNYVKIALRNFWRNK